MIRALIRGRSRCAPLPLRALPLLALPLLAGCDAARLGVMNAAGPVAETQRHLYLILAIVLIFIAGPVLILTPIFAWRYRLSDKRHIYRPTWDFSWGVEALIWLPPTGIVLGLSVLLWTYTHRLDPYRPVAGSGPPLVIQAVALDWKWLFIYPDQRIATIDQMAIPVGRPVRIVLTSGTVMQSLLIPRLAGQIYAMAGMRTELNLAASRAGVFRGENTQYNGTGFARQSFDVLALSPDGYRRWLARVHAAATPLDRMAYAQLFKQTTPPDPVFYSAAPAGLFDTILARDLPPKATRR